MSGVAHEMVHKRRLCLSGCSELGEPGRGNYLDFGTVIDSTFEL